ncbi:hypothetical protein [Paenibacillus sp. 32O-W]|uniref:hypothetical protein n=1 Tax=Paenibacillus sp. 32O-W TaxID=1695218 RepID=UPI000782CDE8|nr:hypothetical protein [Paenibacillus sp. 32O-W]
MGDSERLLAQNRALRELAPHQTFVAVPGGNHTFGAADPYEGPTDALDQAFEETAVFLKRIFRQA